MAWGQGRGWRVHAGVRLPILTVFGWNLQCALVFLWSPEAFAPAFEVQGAVGAALVRSLAVLFVMWNVPYVVALWHPWRHRWSLAEALIMQTIGLLGETWILWRLPAGHATLQATVIRFIVFDGAGVLLLALAFWLAAQTAQEPRTRSAELSGR